jgi:hypothetical protein
MPGISLQNVHAGIDALRDAGLPRSPGAVLTSDGSNIDVVSSPQEVFRSLMPARC